MLTALIKKYKVEIIVSFFLLFLFLLTRFINLTIIPIFTDEAIYLRWAQIAKNDASWRFISLTDGKQPLFIWLVMVAMKFISDPLIAGRVISVLAGLMTMIGLWFLTFEVFKNKRMAFFSSLLYLIYPFALVYDRMALMEAMVGTFAVWSLYLGVLLVRSLRLDVALILGMVLGGGVLTKSSGFFSLYLLPLTLLLFNWKEKKRWLNFSKWMGLVILALIISQLLYGVLRLSPWFNMIAQKDTTFIYTFSEWQSHPMRFFIGNLRGELDWLKVYFTLPLLLLVGGSLLAFWIKFREKLLLFIWFTAPFGALALFGRVLYPRFIFFMSLPLLLLAASFLEQLRLWSKKYFILYTLYFILLFYPVYFGYLILTKPIEAPLPVSDSNQYLNGWPSGYGIGEVVDFLKEEVKEQKIYVATEGTFGLLPYSLELYLVDNPNIEIKGFWPLQAELPEELLEKVKVKPVYFVFYQTQKVPEIWPLELLASYKKGKSNDYLSLYKVLPPKKAK